MGPIHQFTHAGLSVKIELDEGAESPRDWDNLGTMVCFHRRYDLGDEHGYRSEEFAGWDELEAQIQKDTGGAYVLPLYLLDHSGITMGTTPFGCPWDSGQVGFVYVSKAKVRTEYSRKRIDRATAAKACDVLRAEVGTYDEYLRGEVYGYVVEDEDGEHLDSCWGFLGFKHCKEEAEAAAEYCAKRSVAKSA